MTRRPASPPANRGRDRVRRDDGVRTGRPTGSHLGREGEDDTRRSRGQSHVVGVSLMIAITVLALGTLTVTIGSVVESGASSAEADRVADAMTAVADPSTVVGTAEAELRFGDGRLGVAERSIRLLGPGNGSVLERVDSDALVYQVGDYRVVGAGGAVLRAGSGGATMVSEPTVVADRDPGGVLVVGAPAMAAPNLSISTGTGTRVGLRTTVAHDRTDLGERRVRVAVETDYPRPWAEYFRRQNATVLDRSRSLDGDGIDSVVASFAGERQTYLVVHDAELEVTGG